VISQRADTVPEFELRSAFALTITNCEPIIQQVKSRITLWSAKSLSLSGRLLLIKTVVAGISNFWCSFFLFFL
ncbi:unnamed protein product, partial [Thlaspi arvense]